MTAITPDPETLAAAAKAMWLSEHALEHDDDLGRAPTLDEAWESIAYAPQVQQMWRNRAKAVWPLIAAHHEAKALREAARRIKDFREERVSFEPGQHSHPYTESFERWLDRRAGQVERGDLPPLPHRADSIGGDSLADVLRRPAPQTEADGQAAISRWAGRKVDEIQAKIDALKPAPGGDA